MKHCWLNYQEHARLHMSMSAPGVLSYLFFQTDSFGYHQIRFNVRSLILTGDVKRRTFIKATTG